MNHGFVYILKSLTVKLFNLNFHQLEVVSRRDPQLQVSENYSDLTNIAD